jgi:hypothetical protein
MEGAGERCAEKGVLGVFKGGRHVKADMHRRTAKSGREEAGGLIQYKHLYVSAPAALPGCSMASHLCMQPLKDAFFGLRRAADRAGGTLIKIIATGRTGCGGCACPRARLSISRREQRTRVYVRGDRLRERRL